MANPENLIPNEQRTPEQRRINAEKAGKASAKAREEKKRLSQMYGEFLASEFDVEIGDPKEKKTEKYTGEKLVKMVVKSILFRADAASVQLLKEIRESTEGSKLKLDGNLVHTVDTSKFTEQEKELIASMAIKAMNVEDD